MLLWSRKINNEYIKFSLLLLVNSERQQTLKHEYLTPKIVDF